MDGVTLVNPSGIGFVAAMTAYLRTTGVNGGAEDRTVVRIETTSLPQPHVAQPSVFRPAEKPAFVPWRDRARGASSKGAAGLRGDAWTEPNAGGGSPRSPSSCLSQSWPSLDGR